MARRAVWRAAPDDPRTPLGWFVADADARPLGDGPAILAALAILSSAALWNPWTLASLPFLALLVRVRARPPDLSALETRPSPGPSFAVRIEILMDANLTGGGTLLGADEGIATFVDGWLCFAGCRTEFAIRRSDLQDTAASGNRRTLLLADRALVLKALHEQDVERLGRSSRLWSGTTPTPEGESVLPPSGVHATGLARAWHDAFLAAAGILATVGLFLALSGEATFCIAFIGCGAFGSFGRLARVRRLAREDRRALSDERPRPLGLKAAASGVERVRVRRR